ncbi:MAG: TraR/DksA C4-type zinc finger protein [Candidatus Nanopelagicaceae bacterium]|nr:TraR/DksA C4-type zinc finger protein [Candidatus Nanopelagicaceae bacterium]
MVLKKKSAASKPAKKAPAKKTPAKKAPAKKAPAKKAPAKKAPAKKAVAKKAPAKKSPGRPFPVKAAPVEAPIAAVPVVAPVVEERRLVMPPPPRPTKNGKKSPPLKPIKVAPAPVVVAENEAPWSATELKTIRAALAKELVRLNSELASVELEMDALIRESGEGAGDDQADAGTKTFEREHEMSLVINARDMVLQTERALERIDSRTYGRCEECGNPIGKARLQVFPRATLCMLCKQKEERR